MVKKNQIIEIKIDDINFPNKGVGSFEDDKIVIKDTIPGQTVSARISKNRSSGIEGSLIEVIERSPLETEIGCKHFGVCGGCSYQKLTYQNELELKKNQVLKLLDNAGISDYEFLGIIDAPEHEGYRNKCEFSFGDEYKGGPIALGMRKKGSFYEVVNLTDCNIIDEDYLKVIIRDSGKGIAKEDLKYIFDRFYKTDSSRGIDKKSGGLGLSIAKEFVKANGGTIRANSEEGKGTEFIITLKRSVDN